MLVLFSSEIISKVKEMRIVQSTLPKYGQKQKYSPTHHQQG